MSFIISSESSARTITMLLRKWTCFNISEHSLPGKDHQYFKVNVNELQEDVAKFYIVGKPMIHEAETMHSWFSFVQPAKM